MLFNGDNFNKDEWMVLFSLKLWSFSGMFKFGYMLGVPWKSSIFKHYSQNSLKLYHRFFFKLFGQKRLVKSVKVFPASIKSINLMQKYPHSIESFACYSKNICFYVFITDKCFNFFRNMFYSKTIKISNIIILYIQSNPMRSNIRVLIKIYYVSPFLYLGRLSLE